MRLFIFILFLIILYTQGMGMRMGIPEAFFKVIFFILPLSFLLLKSKRTRPAPGLFIIVLYVLWSIMASLYNGEGVIKGLLFTQYDIIGYLVLLGIYNSYFSPKAIRLINRFIFVLFFLQIGAALHEIFFLERMEFNVGTMESRGGGIATTFPMYAFSFFFAAFLFLKKIKFLVLGASFFIVGYASGKLGIYLLLPLIAVIGYFLYAKLEKLPLFNKLAFKLFSGFFVLAIIFAMILPSADHRMARLNFDNKSYIDRIEMFVSYSEQDNNSDYEGYTVSRKATSLRVIEETFKRDYTVFLFGQGFGAYQSIGSIFGESAFEKYKIVYGITGWSYDALVMGWPGMLLHVLFFFILFIKTLSVYRKYPLNNQGKVIVFSCLLNFFTFLINYFIYNYSFTIGGWVIFVHCYFSALVLAPQYRELFINNNHKMI